MPNHFTRPAFLACATLLIAGCGGGESPASGSGSSAGGGSAPAQAALSRVAALGEKLFHDPSLSASGRQSCATCHVADHALAGADAGSVPLGGPAMDQQGLRNTPSIRYLARNPAFHFESDGTPVGGFFRDGRAVSLLAQARQPFLAANEMANASAQALSDRVQRAAYVAEFRDIFGAQVFADADVTLERVAFAIAQYEAEDADFAPFSSKYDALLAGKASFTATELQGLALFNDPAKGNCAACHPSGKGADGAAPLFTDFSYDNLGVPRNPSLAANADPAHFDLGLCGPSRTDLAAQRDLCGAFKVPSLRNVAVTGPYFHNGRFATLREVVAFYVRRDTHPEEWYPLGAGGVVHKFDDLPDALVANVNTTEVPYNRRPGDAPALTPAEIDAVVAFLATLTDGYTP